MIKISQIKGPNKHNMDLLKQKIQKIIKTIKPFPYLTRLRSREEVVPMEDQGFRQFYKALIHSYYLPAETAKKLLGMILHSLPHRKKESE